MTVSIRALLVLVAALLASLAGRAQDRAAQPPVFRAGVDVVQLDVSVLDRDRRPVRGLTAADFTVRVDGRPSPIVAFTAVDLPPRQQPKTVWLRDTPPDVVVNTIADGRLVVVMFDRTIPRGWPTAAARRFAETAIGELGPGDLAAVVHTGVGRSQNFTADRAKLLEAVRGPGIGIALNVGAEVESGECFCGVCSLEAITRVADAVRHVPDRRTALLFIGGGIPSLPGVGECEPYIKAPREEMFRAAHRANLTVHAIDPNGLESFAVTASERPKLESYAELAARPVIAARVNAHRQEELRELAYQTGGRAVVNTNVPEERTTGIFDETASYYLIGVRRDPTDAAQRFHAVDVTVNRRNMTVRTRRGYYDESAPREVRSPRARLDAAVEGLLPRADLPLQVSVMPFAVRGGADAAVVTALGVSLAADGFGADRSADYRIDLPMARLSSGPHLLSIEAVAKGGLQGVRRDVRFSVRSSAGNTDVPERPLSVESLLQAAGGYLVRYEREISAVVAEEQYVQTTSGRTGALQRHLRSDLLVIRDPAAGWVGFRDVYEVDGKRVRDRDDRVARLFLQPNADPIRQAARIVAESSRHNLNPPAVEISRSINMPVMALKFPLEPNQARSRFTRDGTTTIGGRRVAVLRFAERSRPRLIASPDNAAAKGAFWIEPGSGRIIRSELSIQTGRTAATIRVNFGEDARLKLWLPVSMDERYVVLDYNGTVIEGTATYSNFRQFSVSTDTAVKEP